MQLRQLAVHRRDGLCHQRHAVPCCVRLQRQPRHGAVLHSGNTSHACIIRQIYQFSVAAGQFEAHQQISVRDVVRCRKHLFAADHIPAQVPIPRVHRVRACGIGDLRQCAQKLLSRRDGPGVDIDGAQVEQRQV